MTESNFKRIILDVDAGIDDAYAILAFLYAEKIGKVKIEAITSVFGNTSVSNVSKNVARLLELADISHIPIYIGASEALIISDQPYVSTHHGKDGFLDIPLKKELNLKAVSKKVAAIAMNDIVMQNPGEISLVCTGPLTNVALAIKLHSTFIGNVKEVLTMGGNHKGRGNITATAEFNFYMDPEAAQIVLHSTKCPVTILTFETCIKSPIDINSFFNTLNGINSPIMDFLHEINAKQFPGGHGVWYPFDCYLAVAAIFNEIITKAEQFHVTIELAGALTRGQMILDHKKTKTANATIIKKIDVEAFKNILSEILRKLQ